MKIAIITLLLLFVIYVDYQRSGFEFLSNRFVAFFILQLILYPFAVIGYGIYATIKKKIHGPSKDEE